MNKITLPTIMFQVIQTVIDNNFNIHEQVENFGPWKIDTIYPSF